MKLNKYQNKLANFMTDNGVPQDIAVLLASREDNSKDWLKGLPISCVVGSIFMWDDQPEVPDFWADFHEVFREECLFYNITAEFKL